MDNDIKNKLEELDKRVTVLEEKEAERSLAMKSFSEVLENVVSSRIQNKNQY